MGPPHGITGFEDISNDLVEHGVSAPVSGNDGERSAPGCDRLGDTVENIWLRPARENSWFGSVRLGSERSGSLRNGSDYSNLSRASAAARASSEIPPVWAGALDFARLACLSAASALNRSALMWPSD